MIALQIYIAVLILLVVITLIKCDQFSSKDFGKSKPKPRSSRNEYETLGVLLLDSITFPKIVPNSNVNVVVCIINKGDIGNYGTDSMRADYLDFASKGTLHGNASDTLFTQIIVNGAQNRKLAERIGVPVGEKFVTPKLFLFLANSDKPIAWPSTYQYNPAYFMRWISKYTHFFYSIPGIIESFDHLAEKFASSSTLVEYNNIVAEAIDLQKTLTDKEEVDNSEQYIKTMKKVIEKGSDYIINEAERLQMLVLSPEITANKKNELKKKLNIVYQFDRFDLSSNRIKEEL